MSKKRHTINTRLVIIREHVDNKDGSIANVEVSNTLIKRDGITDTQSIKLVNKILKSL